MTFATTDDGTRIAYRTLGSGPIDLVLVHSWSNSSVVYEDMLSGFELNDVRVILADARGTGESGKPATGYTLDRHARDMMAVADTAGARRFVIAGLSMGAQIAMLMSAQWPERVRGQVLFMPVPPTGATLDAETTALLRNSAGNRDAVATIYNFGSPDMPPAARDRLLADAVKVAKPAVQEGFDAWSKASFADRLRHTRASTLLVVSDDPFYPVEDQRKRTAGVIPGARIAYIPGCGHWGPVERPREHAALLQAFLAGAAMS